MGKAREQARNLELELSMAGVALANGPAGVMPSTPGTYLTNMSIRTAWRGRRSILRFGGSEIPLTNANVRRIAHGPAEAVFCIAAEHCQPMQRPEKACRENHLQEHNRPRTLRRILRVWAKLDTAFSQVWRD